MPLAFLAMQISALPREQPFPVPLLDALGTRHSNFKQMITGRILAQIIENPYLSRAIM